MGFACFIPNHVLDRRNPTYDEGTYNYLSAALWGKTSDLARMRAGANSWTSMTKLRLSSSIVTPTQQQMADSFSISTRRLQQNLKEEGTSWQALSDKETMRRAIGLLSGGDTVESVAAAVGMTAGNFRRKFKAATGQTPAVYQKSLT
jgi:AraC-like DNA-binding protein